jgi:hypothetical protein
MSFFKKSTAWFKGQNIGKLEKRGLHDHVDAAAKADGFGDFDRIHIVEFEFLPGNGPLY